MEPRSQKEGEGYGKEKQVHFQEQEGRGRKAKEGLVSLSSGNRDGGKREAETKGGVSEL